MDHFLNRVRQSFTLATAFTALIGTFGIHGNVQVAALIVPDDHPTIQAAIDAASLGDTIIVRAGTYNENITLHKSVILAAETYDPNSPSLNTTIIDGGVGTLLNTITVPSNITPISTIRGFVIRNGLDGINAKSELQVEYNYFIASEDQVDYGRGSGGINHHNIYFASTDDAIDLDDMNRPLTIEHNRILYSADDGIEIRLQDTTAPPQPIEIVIRENEIIGANEDGIQFIDYDQTLDSNRRFLIHNNLIANSRFAGIGLMPNAQSIEDYSGADIIEAIRVYHNTLYGNDYGLSGGDNLVVFNNIITNSTTRGVWRVQGQPGDNSVIAYTLFHQNGVHTEQTELGVGNILDQDPLFVAPPNAGPDGTWGTVDDDFSGLVLPPGSPAIDAGVTQYAASSGELIPPAPIANYSGTAPDLGWKEFNLAPGPTPTSTISPTPTATPEGFGTLISQVSAGADDAEETISTGAVSLGSTDLELGMDASNSQLVGMRFRNISIPRGSTILSAYVEFEVDEIGSIPTSLIFEGQAADNAPTFTTAPNNISTRARTAAQLPWNDVPPWPVLDTRWQSPDLSPIILEITSRAGWVSGNSLVIIVGGTGRRTAESYNGEPPAAPKLVITFTSGPTATPGPAATSTNTPNATPTTSPTRTPTSTPRPTFTPPAAGTLRFAVIGDYGVGGQAEANVSNLVKSWNPDFVITTGDNNYPSGAADTIDKNIGRYYHQFIHPYTGTYGTGATTNRFFPSLGNHDWDTPNAQPYLDYFTLPGNERYYNFIWGPVHFFAIDSDAREPDGRSSTSTQAQWLQSQLAASTSTWNVVYMHHAPYSSGASHGSTSEMQWPYKAWGADVVLAGHNHIYERVLRDGLPYFVNGLGGAPIQAMGSPIAGSQVRYNADHGAMLVEATELHITMQFITVGGTIIDTYVLDAVTTPTPSSTLTPLPAVTETTTPSFTPTETALPSPTSTPVPTFTATSTLTPITTPSATTTMTASPTSPATSPADVIWADGFEYGSLSAWSSSITDAGDLSVSSTAALHGNFGLQALVDDNAAIYLTDDTPAGETRYRARFYFDPNSIAMASGDSHYLLYGYTGNSTLVLRLQLRYSSGTYQLRAAYRNDSTGWTNTSWITIADAPHTLELDWQASSAAGASNGRLSFWIDGVQRANLTGMDNDTRRIDRIRLGAVAGIDTGTRGTYYFDLFESRRQTYIGP